MQPKNDTDHVDDRVHGADLVEFDLVNGGAMDGGLHVRKTFEYRDRAVHNRFGQRAAAHNAQDLCETAMGLTILGRNSRARPADTVLAHRLTFHSPASDRQWPEPIAQLVDVPNLGVTAFLNRDIFRPQQ